MKNYYELLEVNENASTEVIEKAYRVLAKKYHPDVQPEHRLFWAETEFKKISHAYSVLSDPEKRIIYDYENGFADKEVTEYQNIPPKTESPLSLNHFKSSFQGIARGIYNETKASNEDRSKNLKALLLTVIIMAILLFIFWNVPFIRNFLFP